MTPSEINAAIATWMGWTELVLEPLKLSGAEGIPPNAPWLRENGTPNYWPVPNYHGDLNACHSFEEKLTVEQSHTYGKLLDELVNRDFTRGATCLIWADWHATAPERCEALLRTLNLWKE